MIVGTPLFFELKMTEQPIMWAELGHLFHSDVNQNLSTG